MRTAVRSIMTPRKPDRSQSDHRGGPARSDRWSTIWTFAHRPHRAHFASGIAALACIATGALGCGTTSHTAPPPAPPPTATCSLGAAGAVGDAATSARAKPHDSVREAPDSVLVISREIVGACPELQAANLVKAQMDPEISWIVVLESLAQCLNTGALRARRVVVSGGDDERDVVKEVLVLRGVNMAYVSFVATPGASVEVTLVPEGKTA